MRRTILAAIFIASVSGSYANAGVYADDLGKCLVRKTSEADRAALMRWIFGALTLNPTVQFMTTITEEQRTEYAKIGAGLMERLILVDCRNEAAEGLKYEGPGVVSSAFKLLGEVAGNGLMTHPLVTEELGKVAAFLNEAKWDAFTKENELPTKIGPGAAK